MRGARREPRHRHAARGALSEFLHRRPRGGSRHRSWARRRRRSLETAHFAPIQRAPGAGRRAARCGRRDGLGLLLHPAHQRCLCAVITLAPSYFIASLRSFLDSLCVRGCFCLYGMRTDWSSHCECPSGHTLTRLGGAQPAARQPRVSAGRARLTLLRPRR